MRLRGDVRWLRKEIRGFRQNLADARNAMALIRDTVERLAPFGAMRSSEQLDPEFGTEAAEIVRGVQAIADRPIPSESGRIRRRR
jgi:hypothetical protein